MKKSLLLVLMAFQLAIARCAVADVTVSGIFGDHMVLQQGVECPVWGTADAAEAVSVRIGDQSAATVAGADGRWRVMLHPLVSAAGDGPVEMTITGKNVIKLSDLLIGDVWLCSGQSNMVFSLDKEKSAAEELPKADHPDIRLCQVSSKSSREPLADRKLKWAACTPDQAKHFSAVAYYLARDLEASTHHPVGVICAAVSGTSAQLWTSLPALNADPDLKTYIDAYEKRPPATSPAAIAADANGAGAPASLYNGMIAPLVPMALKGIAWYQGESNAGDPLYRKLFPALISDWRSAWGNPNLPFVFVQLPGFGRRAAEPTGSKWALLREAQSMTLSIPNTGMAVSIDLSLPRNILHPPNKRELAHRLAVAARKVAYGETVEAIGPTFVTSSVVDDQISVTFDHTGTGLTAGAAGSTQPTSDAPLKGFAIAGADQHFVFADARIDANSVIVSSAKVKMPLAVRYGWADNPEVNLYNKEGLPAAPFRTDNWIDPAPSAPPKSDP